MIINPTGTMTVTATQISAGNVTPTAHPIVLLSVLVTTTLTAAQNIVIFDNATAATGTVVAIILGGSTAGTLLPFQMACVNGITIQQNAALAAGAITISVG